MIEPTPRPAYRITDLHETEHFASRYQKVWDQGVHNCVQRAPQPKPGDPDKKPSAEQMKEREQWQRDQFNKMMEGARPDMRKFFESMQKRSRPPSGGSSFHGFKK